MPTEIKFDATFGALLSVTVLSALLAGSTLQWAITKGLFTRGWKNRRNQYNIIVAVATISSLIQTITCFINTIMAPDHIFGFSVYIVVNWVFMTHSSVMLVSRKLSLTYVNSERVWRRLLLINMIMLPFSLFICVSWTTSHNFESETLDRINNITEPIQIALWGFIEFCLSGMFIVKMWHFHWTAVERQGVLVLVLVALCDITSVIMNLVIGDLESTCVKGFVYSLRIRLEVSVLCAVVDFVNSKRGSTTYGNSSGESAKPLAPEEEGVVAHKDSSFSRNISTCPSTHSVHESSQPSESV